MQIDAAIFRKPHDLLTIESIDLDKPMDHFLGRNPFPAAVQRFHGRIQNESPKRLPLEIAYGIGLAIADVICGSRRRSAAT